MKLPPDLTRKVLELAGEPPAPARPSKFRNRPVEIDGFRFASEKEGRRYVELRAIQDAGLIAGLRTQCPIRVVVNGVEVCKYIADFVYTEDGREVVEDVKSPITRRHPVYRLKKKLLMAAHGIDIREV